MSKFNLIEYLESKVNVKDAYVNSEMNIYIQVRKLAVHFQFFFSIIAYIVIAEGYFRANYLFLMSLSVISLTTLIVVYIFKFRSAISDRLTGSLFLYIPIANVFVKDIYFLIHKHPLVVSFFLHTHFLLLLFIAIGGLVSNYRNILYIGCVSVIWLWFITICLDDSYLWSLIVLDSVFFIGVSLAVYFTYSIIHTFNLRIAKQTKHLDSQNLELVELMNMKDWLLNVILHDIKNPINRIISATQKDVIRKDDIVESSLLLLTKVENILDVSKMEESKMVFEFLTRDIDELIDIAISRIKYLLEDKKISIFKRAYVKCSLEVDVELLVRVFENLLTNAIKFSKENGIIDINITQKDNKVRIVVLDRGEGIKSDNIDRVFEKYFQIRSQNLGITRSTGLGLTFCKLVVEGHGGFIGVESNSSKTQFWVELPILSIERLTQHETTRLVPYKLEYTNMDEEVLFEYKLKITNFSVYETSKILNVFDSAPSSLPIVISWKEDVLKSSMTGNLDRFKELMFMPDYLKSKNVS